ncbi:phage tail protein [Poseidonibacter lekithochrous]|uniref:phage tail protein n=1 Tax=Poseidonibacter lekithochrous TaxID=1904463 RepID=UPI000D3814C2|nr:phage tail protein [Poseidonibacter lekithochrous]
MEIKLNGVDEVLAKLRPDVYKKALTRTVNDIGSRTKTESVKKIRRAYNIKAKDLKRFMKVKRARYSDTEYVIDVRSSRFNAMRFSPRRLKKKGHNSLLIKKENGRKVLKRSFTAKNGALLMREKNSQKVRAVTTVSIPQMFNQKIQKEVGELAENESGKRLKDNFQFYIGKD